MHSTFLALLIVAIPGFLMGPLLSLLSGPISGALQAALYQLFKKQLIPAMDRWPAWLNQAANVFISLLVTYVSTQTSFSLPTDVQTCLADPAVTAKATCATGMVTFAVQFFMTWVTAHITHSGLKTAALKKAALKK